MRGMRYTSKTRRFWINQEKHLAGAACPVGEKR